MIQLIEPQEESLKVTSDLERGLKVVIKGKSSSRYDDGLYAMLVLTFLSNLWCIYMMYQVQEDLNLVLRKY
jgi:hypothetical protein